MKTLGKPALETKDLQIFLIKPSQYDDDGYVVRHFRGVLPSNTLACLAALTEDVAERKLLGEDLKVSVHMLDETVDYIPVKKICRFGDRAGTKTIVCLVGVQTNQFPRATDLAMRFRRVGLSVLIGGFHVSGYLAMLHTIPPDIQALMDEGVTIVKGEVEETWGEILQDALAGRLKPLYDFIDAKPDLYEKPVPIINKRYLKKFASANFGTVDCGRGCPFNCSFCTIINVQGRKMRFRAAEHLANAIRDNYLEKNIDFYFFTDDNFARNKNWEAIFDALIKLREQENIPISFMMQVDVLSYKIKNFVEKAQRAGCTQVFIGMESINTDNLKAADKNQNNVDDYKNLMNAYHQAEIATHVGFIIGFPHDTVEGIRRDLKRLMEEIRVDQASFFMLTPLPGSHDHLTMMQAGEYMDPDYNKYDSIHETTHHPHLKDGAWYRLYREAWRTFYSFENMKAILLRATPRTYWNIFRNFIWYKSAALIEGRHPMMAGFFRLKDRDGIRPGFPVPSRWEFFKMRAREHWYTAREWLKLFLEMEELWLQTRQRSEVERRVIEEVQGIRNEVQRRLKVAELQLAYARARAHVPSLKVPSKLRLYWRNWILFFGNRKIYTREDLNNFWQSCRANWRLRKPFGIALHKAVANFFRDAQLALMFAFAMLTARDQNDRSRV